MTPLEELTKRIGRLQEKMKEKEIAGALIIQRADLFYFSGTGQNAHLLVPTEGEPILVAKKSFPRAAAESALEKIVPFKGWDSLKAIVLDSVFAGARLGFELDVIPATLFFRYSKLFEGFEPVDVSMAIRQVRAVKSPYEIGLIREAAKISKATYDHAASVIKEGMSEIELSAELEKKARALGHQGAVRMRGFNQEIYYGHILAGANSALASFFDGPTGGAGLNPSYPQGAGAGVIRRGEPLLIDFVGIFGGYIIDQTRIFCVGEPADYLRHAYATALKVKNSLQVMGKPGIKCSALYEKALEITDEAGLADYFMGHTEKVSFVGHGVGIELDELPVIAKNYSFPLEEGAVFALEPKFTFPGKGTVGVEDTFVVGKDGLEQLTLSPDNMQIL